MKEFLAIGWWIAKQRAVPEFMSTQGQPCESSRFPRRLSVVNFKGPFILQPSAKLCQVGYPALQRQQCYQNMNLACT
jgi:hypothetical protein